MRFLVDESVGPGVARALEVRGHDALSVFDVARGALDADVLRRAHDEARILVTADKDFGDWVFRQGARHRGVVLIRLEDERPVAMIGALDRLLAEAAEEVPDAFVVVTDRGIRIRKVGNQ